MKTLGERMPLLARHAGEWRGRYTLVDRDGTILDKHSSHLSITLPSSGPYPYVQTNRYRWDDGRTEEFHFPATHDDGKLVFDTDRIEGVAWETDEASIILKWKYKANPALGLYELIVLSPCGNKRARTWHWFEGSELVRRTLIEETRAA